MAGFRVAEHTEWRDAKPPETPGPNTPADPATAAEPDVDHLRRRVEALGPVGYPARLYDGMLGRWTGRSRLFLVLRFLLVATTVLLLVGGVNGESLVEHEVGAYRIANAGGAINHYLSPSAPQQYLVEADIGLPDQIFAKMGLDHGTVRVPSLNPSGSHAYALQVKLVRGDPDVRPELGLQRPDGTIAPVVAPASDDGVTIRYDVIPIQEAGTFKFVLKSTTGSGRVDMHVSIASAPIMPVEQFRPDWLPLVGGLALGTVLLGAYTPGAATLAQMRRAEDAERPYRMAQDPAAYADRVVPVEELETHPDAKLAYRDE